LTYSDNAEETLKKGIWGKGQQYVMPWHPHGQFTVGAVYFVAHWWSKNYPGGVAGDRFVVVAPLLLRIPLLAEYLLLCHSRSQDSKTFNALLASGATVAVQPGGLMEQVSTDAEQEKVYFAGNLGFIRMALKHGVPLLPVYAFGENQLYRTVPWVRRINEWCYRKLKTGSLVVLGQFGLINTPALPNPFMLPIRGAGMHIRFGEPVNLGPADPAPSDAKIEECFKKYVTELQRMFDEHKDSCLPPEVAARGLKVIRRPKAESVKEAAKL